MYKVGDYVIIKSEDDTKTVGKIEEIFKNSVNSYQLVRYTKYFSPSETPEGKQEHNSINEVYKSSDKEKEFYSSIINRCQVLPLDIYLKKGYNRQSKNVFFYRQKYLENEHKYLPENKQLKRGCYCNTIINPDTDYSLCPKCNTFYHIECINKISNKVCPNPDCGNILDSTISTNQKLLGNKRERQDDKKKYVKFKNLPEKNRNTLIKNIDQIEKVNHLFSKGLDETTKSRKNAQKNFLYALLYGIEEMKVNINKEEFWKNLEKIENKYNNEKNRNKILNMNLNSKYNFINKESINDNEFINKYCEILSIQIEFLIFLANNENTGDNYKKKILTLYTNLRDERNSELRLSVLTNQISIEKLVELSSEELAPTSVQKKRLEQEAKYFKEQVLRQEDEEINAISRKGILLSVEPVDKNTENLNQYDMLEGEVKEEGI